jgi:protoporphyrinogen oxidase
MTFPPSHVVVVGAGPAGLTAAYQLVKSKVPVTVFESDDVVGGISRTAERDGWRFDIGGHRFFTKVPEVEALWHEILGPDDFLTRPRMSRIFYEGKFYDYPIQPFNALRNLGVSEAVRCVGSYLLAKVRPPRQHQSLEDYVVANYGRRLYNHFFKTYNEKVWGVPASQLSADWGAQRIKGMSLARAVYEPVRARLIGNRSRDRQVTSLIEEFQYPKYGPGMMWERCAALVEQGGGTVMMRTRAESFLRDGSGVHTVVGTGPAGSVELEASHVVSSMPISDLVASFDPVAPDAVLEAAKGLRYRDFFTVALVVPLQSAFPDTWIYIHSPKVRMGRIQNFGSWSPYLVKEGRACLGLEYWANEGDDLWSCSDEELVELGKSELGQLGLADPSQVSAGYVVRMPKAYPVYDEGYDRRVERIRAWIESEVPNLQPVGRNGMHRYNNQDHSMLTAMLAVENILGASHDIWSVNVEADYHEERSLPSGLSGTSGATGTGRSAPVLPAS